MSKIILRFVQRFLSVTPLVILGELFVGVFQLAKLLHRRKDNAVDFAVVEQFQQVPFVSGLYRFLMQKLLTSGKLSEELIIELVCGL